MRDNLAFLTDNIVHGIATASRSDKVAMYNLTQAVAKGEEITEAMKMSAEVALSNLRQHLPNAGVRPVGSTPLSRPSPVAA